jgi:hypothetical protein
MPATGFKNWISGLRGHCRVSHFPMHALETVLKNWDYLHVYFFWKGNLRKEDLRTTVFLSLKPYSLLTSCSSTFLNTNLTLGQDVGFPPSVLPTLTNFLSPRHGSNTLTIL